MKSHHDFRKLICLFCQQKKYSVKNIVGKLLSRVKSIRGYENHVFQLSAANNVSTSQSEKVLMEHINTFHHHRIIPNCLYLDLPEPLLHAMNNVKFVK